MCHGDEVGDDGHRETNGHSAVHLPNPFVPVQCAYSRLNHRIQPITTPCGVLHAIEINAKRSAPGLVQTQDSDPLIQRRLIYSVLLNAPNARYVFEMAS